MLNKNFVKSMVFSRINGRNEINNEEFCDLFGGLDEFELDDVLGLLKEMNVSVVEEKTDDFTPEEVSCDLYPGTDPLKLIALTNEQLCVIYQHGERAAMDALVLKNKRLVWKIAFKAFKDYKPAALEDKDLYQEGNIGMMKAAGHFDAAKGFKFSTYACWWIRQTIVRAIMDQGFTIRLPVHMHEQITRLRRCIQRHNPQTMQELQSLLKDEGHSYTIEKLNDLMILSDKYAATVSLNETVGEGDTSDTELAEFVPADTNVEEEAMRHMAMIDINRAMTILTPRERKVLTMRFGLGDACGSMTLEQISREFNVTRERIRQIEKKALHKLAHSRQNKHLREYLAA